MAKRQDQLNIFGVVTFLTALALIACAISGIGTGLSPSSTRPLPSVSPYLVIDLPTVTPSSQPEATLTPEPTATATLVSVQTATSPPSPSPIPTQTPSPTTLPTVTPVPPTPTQIPTDVAIKHVVIISVDGLRPDALDLADTPTFDTLRAAGAFSSRARAVVPPVTLINHASMLGGMNMDKHGITWNIHEPSLGKINGPTLFTVAHEAGLSTAMVIGKPKFEHLVLPGSVDTYIYAGATDQLVTERVLQLLQAGLPHILFIHLPDLDTVGHLTGWMSAEQLLALARADRLIGEILSALQRDGYLEKTLMIVTSDHGGSQLSHSNDSPEDVTIPWLAVGPGVAAGIILESDIVTYDTAATVLYALDLPVPEIWDGQPVLAIFD